MRPESGEYGALYVIGKDNTCITLKQGGFNKRLHPSMTAFWRYSGTVHGKDPMPDDAIMVRSSIWANNDQHFLASVISFR